MTADPAPADVPPTAGSIEHDAPAFTEAIRDEIVRQSIDAIIITDPTYMVRVWNPAAERLYGIAPGEAVGNRLSNLIDTRELDGGPLDVPTARETVAGGPWRRRVLQSPLRGSHVGEAITVDSVVTTLRDARGTAIAILG